MRALYLLGGFEGPRVDAPPVIMGPPVDPDADNHQGIPEDRVQEVLAVMRDSGLDALEEECSLEQLNAATRRAAELCGIEQGPPPVDEHEALARRMTCMHPGDKDFWYSIAERERAKVKK